MVFLLAVTNRTVFLLAVTDRTVSLGVNVLFGSHVLGELLLVPVGRWLPIQLGHELFGPQVFVGVFVACDAPGHRQLLVLVHDFHLVDATVAADATDARIDVGGVVEKDVFGQIVDSFPLHALAGFPAFLNRLQVHTVRPNRRQCRLALFVLRTVTIDARCRRRNRGVCGLENRVVTISTIQFQLAGVNRMAERNRLLWLVTNIQCFWVGRQASENGSKETTAAQSGTQNQ